ncbi:MAG: NAD-glutamate dehydrogenase [Egibacteraceae bacterium]
MSPDDTEGLGGVLPASQGAILQRRVLAVLKPTRNAARRDALRTNAQVFLRATSAGRRSTSQTLKRVEKYLDEAMDDHTTCASVQDSGALRTLLDRIDSLLPAEQAVLVKALARASYRFVPARRFAQLNLDVTARSLARVLVFIERCLPGAVSLRVEPDEPGKEGTGADPSGTSGTIVEIHMEDAPFLLATVEAELEQLGLHRGDVLHPVFGVRRDDGGRLVEILPARGAAHRETYLRLSLSHRLDSRRCADVADRVAAALQDVRRATRDYQQMCEQLEEVLYATRASAGSRYELTEVDEVIDLLNWLRQDHFILLGYREYDLFGGAVCVKTRSGLGILDDETSSAFARPVAVADLSPAVREEVETGRLLIVTRTNRLSTVYRHVPMVYVGVKKVHDGEITGEFRLLGLYAQRAFAEPSSEIPVLRRKLASIVANSDLIEHSHDERAVRLLFDSFPKHELFEADAHVLARMFSELLDTSRRHEPRVLLRDEPARQSVSALVAVPRERFSDEVLLEIQRVVERWLGGRTGGYHLAMADQDMALLHFRVDGVTEPAGQTEELDRRVAALLRTFHDDLMDALADAWGHAEANRILASWGRCLPLGYTDSTDVTTAREDLAELERLRSEGTGDADAGGREAQEGSVRMALRQNRSGDGGLRFRLYRAGPSVEPARILPVLESLGLAVVEEVPHRLVGTPIGEVHIHDYGVRGHADLGEADRTRLARAALAMWEGRSETDSLNRLVDRAGVEWEDVAVLRAYRRYRRQVGTPYTESYTNDALAEHPLVARALLDYFAARLDPADGDRTDEEAARQRVEDALAVVERLDQDRILRGFLNLVDATLRTNRWRQDRQALALKLESTAVMDMPKPLPYVEIFVSSPELEAVHLRGGPIARGGVRWSDRVEDFRTEVLGLMKTQMTKNAVIVPTGAKGGFVLKRRVSGTGAGVHAEVRRQYETFVRALLDVTDNVVGGHAVHPEQVRARDGDDPYLVVAADRGTATFSDLANAIAAEYGCWLGDAFASGGSHGYDHKALGITARGAWVAVQRHFRELGVDVQTEAVTVVGVGDMSGDVFGNGMLRSHALELVAAFDHRDIFLDPDPDPARAYEERKRLFELESSSWQDYDREVLSPGGGVWPRTVKRIPLADPVRRRLGIAAEAVSPPELIQALLGARVDLLFFGGIGTFVKASGETHADVGDRANDAIRIDANQLRARVIGEGANLGVTQRGRIEYALKGGRCNTDWVDNSAGVDTSDREVNLKILFAAASDAGTLEEAERDELLRSMSDEVGAAACRDVYLQTRAISQEFACSSRGMDAYEQLMTDLEAAGRLDRDVEALPSSAETERRCAVDAGLTRPEAAVLLCHAKAYLVAQLLDSPLPDQLCLQSTLRSYFPSLAVTRFGGLLDRHRLRRELVATVVANDVLNRMGVTWVSRTAHEFGCADFEVVSAYWVAREVADADALYRSIEDLDERVEPLLQMELESQVDQLLDTYARVNIRHGGAGDIAAAVAMDRPVFGELEEALLSGGSHGRRGLRRPLAQRYEDLGLESELANRIACLPDLEIVPDVAAVARASRQPVPHVYEVFVGLASALPFDLLRDRLARLKPDGHWERWQHRGLLDELAELGRAAATRAICGQPDASPDETVVRFLADRAAPRERVRSLIRMLDRSDTATLHALAVVVRALHGIL